MIGTCAGWMQEAVVKPSALPRFRPGPIGIEVVDIGELAHRAHGQDAGGAAGGQAMHGEDVHAVGRGNGAELGRHVLAAHRHAGHARLGGDGMRGAAAPPAISINTRKRVWPIGMPSAASRSATSSASSRTCSGPMTLGSIRAATPGITDAAMSATARSSGRLMRTTTSAPFWATRGTAAGERGAGIRLARRQDRILEIEDDGIGATLVRLRQETLREHRHEQQRSPGGLKPGHLMFSNHRVASCSRFRSQATATSAVTRLAIRR